MAKHLVVMGVVDLHAATETRMPPRHETGGGQMAPRGNLPGIETGIEHPEGTCKGAIDGVEWMVAMAAIAMLATSAGQTFEARCISCTSGCRTSSSMTSFETGTCCLP
nr:hypothetical protein [Candidatus Sigynarchaeota archaeon]